MIATGEFAFCDGEFSGLDGFLRGRDRLRSIDDGW